MENYVVHQLPVIDIYDTAVPYSATSLSLAGLGLRIPARKTYTSGGLMVLVLYKVIVFRRSTYLLVARNPQGDHYDRYYYAGDVLSVTDEDFILSQTALKVVENFGMV